MVGKINVKKAGEAVRKRLSIHSDNSPGKHSPDLERCANKRDLLQGQKSETPEKEDQVPRYVPEDWDDSLPYGGKVYLARKKKPESFLCLAIQGILIVGSVCLLYYGWYYTEHLHYHATKLYAHFGHRDAQAIIGHKLLHGKGVEKNHTEAMKWLYEAAKKGHPHAAYNVAVGHLQGIRTPLKEGESRKLIQHAAEHGVEEAVQVFENVCSKGKCN